MRLKINGAILAGFASIVLLLGVVSLLVTTIGHKAVAGSEQDLIVKIVETQRVGCERGNTGTRAVLLANTRAEIAGATGQAKETFEHSLKLLTAGTFVRPDGTVDCNAAYPLPIQRP